MQRSELKSIIIATITALVCFVLIGLLLAHITGYFFVAIFGLLGEKNKYEDSFVFIAFSCIAFVAAYIATLAGLFMVNKHRKICSIFITVFLQITYFIFFFSENSLKYKTTTEILVYLVLIPVLILFSSIVSSRRFIKNIGDNLIPTE